MKIIDKIFILKQSVYLLTMLHELDFYKDSILHIKYRNVTSKLVMKNIFSNILNIGMCN